MPYRAATRLTCGHDAEAGLGAEDALDRLQLQPAEAREPKHLFQHRREVFLAGLGQDVSVLRRHVWAGLLARCCARHRGGRSGRQRLHAAAARNPAPEEAAAGSLAAGIPSLVVT